MEGIYDEAVYKELIQKICVAPIEVFCRQTGGVVNLMKTFPGLLRTFEHIRYGDPVERAVVIRDCGIAPAAEVEQWMQTKMARYTYNFPYGVQLHATRRTVETWLLADADAINAVAVKRQGRQVDRVGGVLEDIADPKGKLTSVLSAARLAYSPVVAAEIARHTDLNVLKERCPSFVAFESKIL